MTQPQPQAAQGGTPGFSTAELAALERFSQDQTAPVPLRLTLSDDPRSHRLRGYAEALQAAAPVIALTRERLDGAVPPALRIGRALRFHAAPTGTELAPFLQAIAAQQAPPLLPPDVARHAGTIQAPVRLTLFVADACPYCPLAVQQLLPLAWASPFLQLAVADAALFDDLALQAGVRAVPTLVLAGGLRWTQRFPLPEIVAAARSQDPSALGADTLEHMLAEGNAELLARMLVGHGRILPAFVTLLAHERWPVRLGAMVAVEYLAAHDPALAAQLLDPLQQRFASAADPVRGDLLHVIGQVAGGAALPWLERIARRPLHPEVADALREATAEIRRRLQD
jgi:hypothetical protein